MIEGELMGKLESERSGGRVRGMGSSPLLLLLVPESGLETV